MSDYLFMLESHLSADQSRLVSQVQAAASQAGVSLFLTGGALRDMLAGLPIIEIDFTTEGDALKLARAVAASGGAQIADVDEGRKCATLLARGGFRATIGAASGSIHEDLRARDFTINSIALSLNAASRGLLLDPNNGVGDIDRKELRAITNYTLYDDPVRLLRLQRFRVRLGFSIVERTQAQYANAREAALEKVIPPSARLEELRRIASEQNVAELVRVLDEEKLMILFGPALSGPKVNLQALLKLQRARQMTPLGTEMRIDFLALVLNLLAEKLTPVERAGIADAIGLDKSQFDQALKLEARSKKLEKELLAANLAKPSLLYHLLSEAPGEQIVWLMIKSTERLAQDRIKNYLMKYLPAAQEITEQEVVATGAEPGTAKYERVRAGLIAARLNARPKKAPVAVEPPMPVITTHTFARKPG